MQCNWWEHKRRGKSTHRDSIPYKEKARGTTTGQNTTQYKERDGGGTPRINTYPLLNYEEGSQWQTAVDAEHPPHRLTLREQQEEGNYTTHRQCRLCRLLASMRGVIDIQPGTRTLNDRKLGD